MRAVLLCGQSTISLRLRQCRLTDKFCSRVGSLKDSKEVDTTWTMASILKLFCFICLLCGGILWFVQPDRSLLQDIEQEIGATTFNEVERRMGELGFKSQTLTYFALADRFSRGDGSHPIVFMSSEVRQAF